MEVSNAVRYSCIPGMLVFGTSTVVIQKIIFSMKGTGRHGDVHKFEKPWFQTEAMFIGMMLCLVVFEIKRCMQRHKKVTDLEEGLVKKEEEGGVAHWKKYVYVMAPAMCDLLATCLMNIVPASVWQMLRGSMVIFSAILSIIFLKRKLQMFNWAGILFVTIGLVIVAISCLEGNTTPGPKSSAGEELFGIIIVVGAQVVQASQIVIEEFLLKNIKADPFLIVGLEGFWGSIVCSLVLVPIYYIPATSAIGCKFHEDTIDTFDMLKNNPSILATGVLYVFAILGYNLFGMLVTQTFTAVHRTILEAVRTMCIWVTNVFIYYVVTNEFGEKLVGWSAVEFAGFVFLLIGLFIYNKVIKLPCVDYDDK